MGVTQSGRSIFQNSKTKKKRRLSIHFWFSIGRGKLFAKGKGIRLGTGGGILFVLGGGKTLTFTHVHESIIGEFSNGLPIARLENKTEDTWALLTNNGHDGAASKDVLKIGHLAGNIEFVRYTIQLLLKNYTGCNYFNDNISRSEIVTR